MAKQKVKTKKAVKKRCSLTGSGKVKRTSAGKGHLLTCKTRKRKRKMRQSESVSKAESIKIRKMIPYS